jgi:endonuclease III
MTFPSPPSSSALSKTALVQDATFHHTNFQLHHLLSAHHAKASLRGFRPRGAMALLQTHPGTATNATDATDATPPQKPTADAGSEQPLSPSLEAWLTAHGLGRYTSQISKATDAETVEDLGTLDADEVEKAIALVGLHLVTAKKLRRALSDLRAASEAPPTGLSLVGASDHDANVSDVPSSPSIEAWFASHDLRENAGVITKASGAKRVSDLALLDAAVVEKVIADTGLSYVAAEKLRRALHALQDGHAPSTTAAPKDVAQSVEAAQSAGTSAGTSDATASARTAVTSMPLSATSSVADLVRLLSPPAPPRAPQSSHEFQFRNNCVRGVAVGGVMVIRRPACVRAWRAWRGACVSTVWPLANPVLRAHMRVLRACTLSPSSAGARDDGQCELRQHLRRAPRLLGGPRRRPNLTIPGPSAPQPPQRHLPCPCACACSHHPSSPVVASHRPCGTRTRAWRSRT